MSIYGIKGVKLTLDINSDSAAIVNDHQEEIARVLEELAWNIRENGHVHGDLKDLGEHRIGDWSMTVEQDG